MQPPEATGGLHWSLGVRCAAKHRQCRRKEEGSPGSPPKETRRGLETQAPPCTLAPCHHGTGPLSNRTLLPARIRILWPLLLNPPMPAKPILHGRCCTRSNKTPHCPQQLPAQHRPLGKKKHWDSGSRAGRTFRPEGQLGGESREQPCLLRVPKT